MTFVRGRESRLDTAVAGVHGADLCGGLAHVFRSLTLVGLTTVGNRCCRPRTAVGGTSFTQGPRVAYASRTVDWHLYNSDGI